MLFFVMYVAVRRLLRVYGWGSSVVALEVENAVLRHELAVLRRTLKRPPLRATQSSAAGRREQAAAARAVVGVPGFAADAASLAPRTRCQEVDVPPPLAGPPADRSRAPRARAAPRAGESGLGMRADPGRAA